MIYPTVVYPVRVGNVLLGQTTTIGKTIVIGGSTGAQSSLAGRALVSRPYGSYGGYVAYVPEESVEWVDVGSAATLEPSAGMQSSPVPSASQELEPLPEPRAQQARQPSLASLGPGYSFTPWYAVSEFVMAGYPVPYPAALAVTYDKVAAHLPVTPPRSLRLRSTRSTPVCHLCPIRQARLGG